MAKPGDSDLFKQILAGTVATLAAAAIIAVLSWAIHHSRAQPVTSGPAPSAGVGLPAPRTKQSHTSPAGRRRSRSAIIPSPTAPTSTVAEKPSPTPIPTVPVLTAEYLSDQTPLPTDTPGTEPQQMGGIIYTHAISTSSGGCGDNQQDTYSYVINRKFKEFKAIIGLNDESVDDVPVDIEVIADGRTIFAKNFVAGDIVHVTRNISGVREVDLKQIYLGPNPNTCSRSVTAVWANPEVLP